MKHYLLITIILLLYAIVTYSSSSQYKGVTWDKNYKKWTTNVVCWNYKNYQGGNYDNEVDAAKGVNQLCDELGIKRKNPGVDARPNEVIFELKHGKTSQYSGVSWFKNCNRWRVDLWFQKQHKASYHVNELDAAKRVNQICNELGIKRKNPGVDPLPIEKMNHAKTSQYTGVSWFKSRNRWKVDVRFKNLHRTSYHVNELDAAKRVNQICDELGIKRKNPGVNAMPGEEIKNWGTSQYRGVCWMPHHKLWKVDIKINHEHKTSYHATELGAARKVNQLCDEFKIKRKNPNVDPISNKEEECKTLLDYGIIKAELKDLIKLLDRNKDRDDALSIRKTLIEFIRHDSKDTKKKKKLNLQTKNIESALCIVTKNIESALCIAAKHGFSNVVKFLISKGVNKEHVNHENHHTPLFLAVSHDHLKVVEVLFEEWITPNSHEEPYLHLLPIFNVRSREIAQLLVDNDAVTNGLYNNKNQSPLTVACQNGYLGVVEFFLDGGLDINHVDNDNKTPLFYALKNKHHDVINLLHSKGACTQITE